jgi:hypothetical protein
MVFDKGGSGWLKMKIYHLKVDFISFPHPLYNPFLPSLFTCRDFFWQPRPPIPTGTGLLKKIMLKT